VVQVKVTGTLGNRQRQSPAPRQVARLPRPSLSRMARPPSRRYRGQPVRSRPAPAAPVEALNAAQLAAEKAAAPRPAPPHAQRTVRVTVPRSRDSTPPTQLACTVRQSCCAALPSAFPRQFNAALRGTGAAGYAMRSIKCQRSYRAPAAPAAAPRWRERIRDAGEEGGDRPR